MWISTVLTDNPRRAAISRLVRWWTRLSVKTSRARGDSSRVARATAALNSVRSASTSGAGDVSVRAAGITRSTSANSSPSRRARDSPQLTAPLCTARRKYPRSEEVTCHRSRLAQIATKTSCTTSSAISGTPTMRCANSSNSRRYAVKIISKASASPCRTRSTASCSASCRVRSRSVVNERTGLDMSPQQIWPSQRS